MLETRGTEMTAAPPPIGYQSVEAAALAVAKWADTCQIRPPLTARPWNRFDPEDSEWYLVPGPEWPAYRYSKVALQPAEQGIMRAVYYVEKGVGEGFGSYYSNKKIVMNGRWAWHRVLAALAQGLLDEACATVGQRSSVPVMVWLDGGTQQDGEYDRAAERERWSYLSYRWSDGVLVHQAASSAIRDPSLAVLTSCTSLADLAQAVPRTEGIGWKWINLYIGVECSLASKGAQSPICAPWDAGKLWRCCFDPWRDWLF